MRVCDLVMKEVALSVLCMSQRDLYNYTGTRYCPSRSSRLGEDNIMPGILDLHNVINLVEPSYPGSVYSPSVEGSIYGIN